MIVAVIAGGSGTRLWPLSTPDYPKHLLKLTNEQSLLQNTIDRAHKFSKDIYVITEASHAHEVRAQLPKFRDEHLIVEPARRGTASCIMLALQHIKSRHGADEVVVFMHADYHIPETTPFIRTVKAAGAAAKRHNKIALIGIKPSYAATGYGYIKLGKKLDKKGKLSAFAVDSFKEKPYESLAEKYVESGQYLWNMGLFAAPIATFETEIQKANHGLFENYLSLEGAKNIEKVYLDFPDQPIDTALIEKSKDVIVVPGHFEWADVGSFYDLYDVGESDTDDNVVRGDVLAVDAYRNFIRNETENPIIVIGLDNVVVVSTPNGTLVCDRDHAQKVGAAIKARLQDKSRK